MSKVNRTILSSTIPHHKPTVVVLRQLPQDGMADIGEEASTRGVGRQSALEEWSVDRHATCNLLL